MPVEPPAEPPTDRPADQADTDFFTSGALVKDPYPSYAALRCGCPVTL